MLDEAREKTIVTGQLPDGVAVVFHPTVDLTLGVTARHKEAMFRVRACLKRYRPEKWQEGKNYLYARYKPLRKKENLELQKELRLMIEAIRHMPLTPRMVCEALDLTAVERIQWARDGRLIRAGLGSFNSGGHKGYHDLYSADCVRKLLNDAQHSSIDPSSRA